jgi:hypothetical protein
MERADTYLDVGAFDSIDYSDGPERKQPNLIANLESAIRSADILSPSGRSPLVDNQFRLADSLRASIANYFPVANNPNASKPRGRAPFLTLSLSSLSQYLCAPRFRGGLRRTLRFALQLSHVAFSFTLYFQTRRAIFNLCQQVPAQLFKVSY